MNVICTSIQLELQRLTYTPQTNPRILKIVGRSNFYVIGFRMFGLVWFGMFLRHKFRVWAILRRTHNNVLFRLVYSCPNFDMRQRFGGLMPSSPTPNLLIQARTFRSTNLICLYSVLTRRYSDSHDRLETSYPYLESHSIHLHHCLHQNV